LILVEQRDVSIPSPRVYTPPGAVHQMNPESVNFPLISAHFPPIALFVQHIAWGASGDGIEVLVHRLDLLQQSCLQAVREGVDKITNSITDLQASIGSLQTHNHGLASSRGSIRQMRLTQHPVRRSDEARRRHVS
jgi:hypothetical protein